MTDSGGDAGSDLTRVDHETTNFPPVRDGGTYAPDTGAPERPLFTPAESRDARSAAVSVERVGQPPTRRGGRWRWLAAGLATILVAVTVGGVLLFAKPQSGTPSLASHYVPADSAMYVEINMDMPGDQHDRLASFMSRFPGFADQAAFDQKLTESLNRLVGSSDSGLDWTTDVEPWFGGQIGMFSASRTSTSFGAVVAVKDRQQLQDVIDRKVDAASSTQQDYNGHTLWTYASVPDQIAYTLTDNALVIGNGTAELQQALDAFDGRAANLAQNELYTQQLGQLHADRLATFYSNASFASPALDTPDVQSLLPAACSNQLSSLGGLRSIGELRAEGDHMAMTTRVAWPSGSGLPMPANKNTGLADRMPANTLGYVEMRNAGAAAKVLVDGLLECMAPASVDGTPQTDPAQMFGQLLGTPLGDYFDFLDDAALGVTYTDGKIGGGIVASVDDETVASQRIDRLLGLVAFGGATGLGITTDEVDHDGVKVTQITLAGRAGDLPAMSFSVAVSGGRLYAGMDDFVINALDRSASDSLSSNVAFQKVLGAGGSDNAGLFFIDLAGLRTAIETLIPEASRPSYDAEMMPFLAPLTSLASVSHADGDILVNDTYLYVE